MVERVERVSPGLQLTGPREDLKAGWRTLYNGYATFYKRIMTDDIAEAVWSWVTDPEHELDAVIAVQNDTAVGLAHFRRMPSPLRGADVGFLDDMFISPQARGQGIAEALFDHLRDTARARGWEIIRWITADDNYRARGVYDRIANKTSWNTYELKL